MKKAMSKYFSVKISVLILLALIVGLLAGYELLTYGERSFTYSKTYQDLARSGLIKKGWITKEFPTSASEIYEMHDIDSNVVRVKFHADRTDIDRLTGGMTPFRIENYEGVDLLVPEKGAPFKRYKRIDRHAFVRVFRNIRRDIFNDYYNNETVEYLAELAADKDGALYYYWTDGGTLVPKH